MNVLTIAFPAKFQIHARFAMNLYEALEGVKSKSGYIVKLTYMLGKSNLSHARSVLVTEWYDSSKPGDLFMFIDTDHSFFDEDILRVIRLKGDLRAGVYCNRAGMNTSLPTGGVFTTAENQSLEFAATGFLCFSYEACAKIHESMKRIENLDRVTISDNVPVEDGCIPFFHPLIDRLSNNGKQYWLGEDFSFSLRAKRAGLHISGAIMYTLGHEIPYVKFYDKPIRGPQQWSDKSIVFYCGNSRVRFSPNDTMLGGSEQAIVFISKEFVNLGFNVSVYGNVEPGIYNKVEYKRHEEFVVNDKFNIIILWRGFGLQALPYLESAKQVFVDLHDATDPSLLPPQLINLKVNKIMVKSNYHRSLFKEIPDSKFQIIPNGLQTELIEGLPLIERQKNRFCYTSCHERGLIPILKYLWPCLKQRLPDAEFHICYGDDLLNIDLKAILKPLLQQEGVFNHGRTSYIDTLKERQRSIAQLYISDARAEIDCLSIREAALLGCIPLLSHCSVFSERAGIHIEGDPNLKSTLEKAVETILSVIALPEDHMDQFRLSLKTAALAQTWSQTASLWAKEFK